MRLIPSESGDFLERLKKQLFSIFGNDPDAMFSLEAEIEETERQVIVRWRIPSCEDIQVYVEQESIKVIGSTQEDKHSGETSISYSGHFSQYLRLPAKVRGEGTQTNYRDGVLEVQMNKA